MPSDLTMRLKEKGFSNRGAGSDVLAAWKKREPRRRDLPKPQSIAVKLGELKRGNATWWTNHPHALAALAALLDCQPDDLILPSSATPDDLGFVEFPELSPLQLLEEPCALNTRGWLGTSVIQALGQGTHAWILAPAGSGKTLAINYLRRRAPDRVVALTARTLIEASDALHVALPLVIEVELTDAATDTPAFAELTARRTNTCVIAPFRRPSRDSSANQRWSDVEWRLEAGWRERFIRWMSGRLLEPERLDVGAVLDWLKDVDPSSDLFSTPGELLPLAAWCYRKASKPTQTTKLEALADEYFTRLLNDAGRLHPWLQRTGREAIKALVQRRIGALDQPKEALPIEAWAELLPDNWAPRITDDEVRRQVDAVASERSAKNRKERASEAVAALSANQPLEAIHLLVEHGILRTQSYACLDLYPTWARRALEQRVFLDRIRAGDIRTWGLWAADQSRKSAVDEALDTLRPQTLVEIAGQLLKEQASELAVVGTIEALFAAVGRRILSGWRPTPEHMPALQALGQRQAGLMALAAHAGTYQHDIPLTRCAVGKGWRGSESWMFEAWSFSLWVSAPSDISPGMDWVLPGWARELRLADAPKDLYMPQTEPDELGHMSVDIRRLSELREVVGDVLGRCVDADVPERVESLFLPWLIIDSPARGWKPKPEHYARAMGYDLAPILGELLAAEGPETQATVVGEIWPHVGTLADGNPFWGMARLRREAPKLFHIIVAHLPAPIFESTIQRRDIIRHGDELGFLGDLPLVLQRSLLRVIARQPSSSQWSAGSRLDWVVGSLGAEDLELLVEIVPSMYTLGDVAAKRVFTLDPATGLSETRAALEKKAEHAHVWVYAAPRQHWPNLLDLIESLGVERIALCARWLARKLPLGGIDAPRMFQLLCLAESAKTGREPGS